MKIVLGGIPLRMGRIPSVLGFSATPCSLPFQYDALRPNLKLRHRGISSFLKQITLRSWFTVWFLEYTLVLVSMMRANMRREYRAA